jgi:hypothetical protein
MDWKKVKIEVFVPESHLDSVRSALVRAGAGRVGDYDHCFSVMPVTGTWRPLDSAQPYDGRVGEISEGSECKLETSCPFELVEEAVAATRQAHPYEEPVINIIPLFTE